MPQEPITAHITFARSLAAEWIADLERHGEVSDRESQFIYHKVYEAIARYDAYRSREIEYLKRRLIDMASVIAHPPMTILRRDGTPE